MSKIGFISTMGWYATRVFEEPDGVNPSVIVAQAILESCWGNSELAKYNNFLALTIIMMAILLMLVQLLREFHRNTMGK